jgi:hypothetical protein
MIHLRLAVTSIIEDAIHVLSCAAKRGKYDMRKKDEIGLIARRINLVWTAGKSFILGRWILTISGISGSVSVLQ